MKIPRTVIYAVVFLTFTTITSSAQLPARTGSRVISNETQENFDSRPFDLSVDRLSVFYHGTDIRALYEKLLARHASMQKDEFETTDQYHRRLQQEEAKPILGTLTADSVMALELRDVSATYNADEELMNVSLTLGPRIAERLSFVDFNGGAFVGKIKMDIPTAKRTKPNLRALAVFKLVKPYLVERWMTAKLLEVWFYDISTGQVFIRKKSEEAVDPKKESLSLAIQYFNDGRDEEAVAEARRVLTVEPMNAEAYLLLGRINIRRGDPDAATSALKTAIFWDAKLIDSYILLGRIFLDRGDRSTAMIYVRNALQIDPNNREALDLQRRIQ